MTHRMNHVGVVGALILAVGFVPGCGDVPVGELDELGSTEEAIHSNCELRLFTPEPNPAAIEQIAELKADHRRREAKNIREMVETPQAVWLVSGSPADVRKQARKVMKEASRQREIPVLVAYNLPFRDCAQFSAGGATTKEAYFDWIDGLVRGIGDGAAIVILEPDGLGIIPFYNPFASREVWLENPDVLEWCQPSEADPATAASDRFEMLNYAVDALKANPKTRVYLDGTHSGWLGAGDAADRLLQAGVARANGFFLNASNYQADDKLEKYGAWVAKCTWFADPASGSWGAGHAENCGSQYYPATFEDFSSWALTDQWYVDNVESQTWVPYPGDAGIKHFVVDTSRNGVGPWVATDEQKALGDVQDWCNPPARGLGLRPTLDSGNALIDARLWIKIPGESDGECNRWEPLGSPDPVREMMDPAAGAWFPEMALELTENANPAL